MSGPLHRATLLILAVGLLVPAGLAAQDIVYTGCIRSADGSLYGVRQGTTPMAPCRAKDRQISWNMAGQPGPPGPAGPSLPRHLGIDVNCAEHQSINAALAQQAERLTISISGTCVEGVVITRDDVTLQGVGTNPTVAAPEGAEAAIVINGAQRVHLQGLALTGGFFAAVHASEGASFHSYQLKISNPTGVGLFIWGGSTGWVGESEIAGCQASGAALDNGSSLYLENSQVIDNGREGVFVQGSVLSLIETNVARNNFMGIGVRNGRVVMERGSALLDNGMGGISLGASQMYMDRSRIAGNRSAGIGLDGGSTALLGNVIVQGNEGGVWAQGGSAISVSGASTIIEGGTGTPGIMLRDTSMGNVSAEASITGSPHGIECAESPSVAQLTWPVPATVSTNCPQGH